MTRTTDHASTGPAPHTPPPQDVWRKMRPVLARLAAAFGARGDDADDIVQDVFARAAAGGTDGLDVAAIEPYLRRMTVNRCMLEHRRRSRRRRLIDRLKSWFLRAEPTTHPAESAGEREEREMVRSALASMDESLRTVLVLRYYENLDSRQIGQTLNLNDSTVRSRLRAGRLALANALRSMSDDHARK